MLERFLVAIHVAHPHLRLRVRAVVEAIVLAKGPIGSAESVARTLGLKNRFRLARLLQSEGLPPLHRLTEWVTVLSWAATAEDKRVSLCWLAFRSSRHPSACYRLVKKVTGHAWEEVRARGSVWVLRQFLKELKTWHRRGGGPAIATPAKRLGAYPPGALPPRGPGATRVIA